MDFTFTPEQDALREQAREFLAANPEPTWAQLAELGWTGVSVAEEDGGAGLSFLEEAVLFEELGRALYRGPYFATIGLTLPALPAELRAEVAAGEASWTLAFGPLVPDLDTATPRRDRRRRRDLRARGRPSARSSTTTDESRPLGVVRGGEPGQRLADSAVLPEIEARSQTALALEACGVARLALEDALEYASSREQFGKKIGVVPGRVASARRRVHARRALPLARALGGVVRRHRRRAGADRGRRPRSPTPARAPSRVCETAIQSLGGIGFTWEHRLHRLYKRALGIESFGASGTRLRAEIAASLLERIRDDARRERRRRCRSHEEADDVDGLMMDYQLNVPALLRRADELYGENEIASRLPDKSWHRYSYADFVSRTKKLVVALRKLGLEDGDRVGTFMWNHSQHLETYMGSPVGGFVTHTLNLRLHPDDNTYIATPRRRPRAHRRQGPVACSPSSSSARCRFEHVIAVGDGPTPDGAIDYEELIADADESAFAYRDIPEKAAAAMCYTSGTTGRPKGVLYSHRAIAIHALTAIGCLGMHADDVCLPVVPDVPRERVVLPVLLHDDRRQAGLPRPAPRSRQPARGLPGAEGDVTAGVPTIWMGILQTLDANPGVVRHSRASAS